MNKRICATFVAVFALVLSASADDVYDFFKSYLNGRAKTYQGSKKKMSLKEVQQNSVAVWKSWRRALRKVEPDTLGRMNKDSLTYVGKWRLPPDLENDATMNFTWFSKGARPSAGYPMFLYMHGSGPKAQEYANGLKLTHAFNDGPAVYFVPQIPNEGGYYRWWQRAKVWAWQKMLRLAFASGDIDPDRIYITGISEGAYGTQRLASFFADYLAGGGAMAGGEPLKNAPAENLANTPFSLLTGDHDSGFYRNTLTKYAKDALDSLSSAHDSLYVHNVQLLQGCGHAINYYTTTPWLAAHKRNPYPKYVAWEDFEMDGCRRDGFYNLFVNESPAVEEGARVFYEETIKGDTINLKVQKVEYTTVEKDNVWGIEMKFKKKYTPLDNGKITIYLNRSLANLSHRLTVVVNGRQVFNGKVLENLSSMVNSCAAFGDPRRLYTAQIDVDIASPAAEK